MKPPVLLVPPVQGENVENSVSKRKTKSTKKTLKFLLDHSIGTSFEPSTNEQTSEIFVKAVDEKYIENMKGGEWQLTEEGKEVIA